MSEKTFQTVNGQTTCQINFEWRGEKISKENHDKAKDAIWKAMEDLLEKANQMVPHDVGDLERSGQAICTDNLIGVVGYNTPYAVRLHEHPEYKFQKGREGKWLERAVNRAGPEIIDRLEKELKF